MKLYELSGVKKYQHSTPDQLIDIISGAKDVTNAGGAAAKVFIKGNIVYKFWAYDSAYEKFINYVLENHDNESLPKIKGSIRTLKVFFRKPEKFPEKLKYVKMEKLTPLTSSTQKFEDKNHNVYDIIKLLNDVILRRDDKDTLDFIDVSLLTPAQLKNLKDLIKIVKDLKTVYKGTKLVNINGENNLDIHKKNIMMRGDTYVITDPALAESDLDSNDDLNFVWNKHTIGGYE